MGIVLFLGAGINFRLVPTWKTLLGELLETALEKQFKKTINPKKDILYKWAYNELDAYDQAALIRQLLGNQYLFLLHKALYNKTKQLPQKGTLYQIANLCLKNQIHAIVTYNYDDLLECKIDEIRKDYAVPIYGKRRIHIHRNKLPVYHVHGYLPWKKKLKNIDDSQVVLGRHEYYDQMMEPYAWQITLQLDFLQNNICIYLGTSMTDMNMLRIAHHALRYAKQPQIYMIEAKEFFFSQNNKKYTDNGCMNTKVQEQILRVKATLLHELNTKLILAKNQQEYEGFLKTLSNTLKSKV
jgi:hypothetical protein